MLVDLKVNEFVNVLASDAPAPGGGSASALAGAMGIGLVGMVATLTTGKEKYKEYEDIVQEVLADANILRKQFLEAIDRDTDAFNVVTAAYTLPKATDEEKAARSSAIQLALKEATKVPFELMELCLQALKCAEKAIGKTNKNAASDLGVAALNLKSAVQGAWLNVLINLGGIKDEAFVNEYRQNGTQICTQVVALADIVYNEILKSL